jgi:acetyl esterase/lipase
MTSKHLVDSELAPALDFLPPMARVAAELPALRAALAAAFASDSPPQDNLPVSVEIRFIPTATPGHALRLLLVSPNIGTTPLPALLHIHGGGYLVGAPDMMLAALRKLSADIGCVICSVDYRLAPETPHPGPLDDCYTALEWLHDNALTIGVDPMRIGVSGESAGGGLAAAMTLLARDRGKIKLVYQHLIYPMLDDRTCTTEDPHPYTGEFVWNRDNNRLAWTSLLGVAPGGDGISPYAAPARATELSRLPAAFIAVGALDLFLEENMEYARRLTRAGVPVELHVYPGAFHGFEMAATARISIAAERDSRSALRHALGAC